MKWDNIAIEELLQKYYEGETSITEEKLLQDFFNQQDELPEGLRVHASQFRFFARQQEEQLNKFLSDDWLFEKIEKQESGEGKQIKLTQSLSSYWRIAASVLLVLGAFWAGSQYKKGSSAAQSSDIAALQQEVQEMKKVLASGASTDYSASDRIQVVSQDLSTTQVDDEIISLLIRTMNQDPNVNVRLAASEALYQYRDNERVRTAFIKALPIQTDPLMQITLIDMLVNLQEKKAVEPLQKLVEKKNLLPIVKDKAEEGIGILI